MKARERRLANFGEIIKLSQCDGILNEKAVAEQRQTQR